MVYGFLVLAGYMVLKPVRDEFGSEHRELLKTLWTWTFVVMCIVAPIYGWIAARVPRRLLVPGVLGFGVICLLIFRLLFALLPDGEGRVRVEIVFYVWVSVFNLYAVSLYWAQMAAHFRSDQSRRLFGLVMVGSTTGAVVGPLLVTFLVPWIGVPQMLILAAALYTAAASCSFWVPAREDVQARALPGDLRGLGAGLRTVIASPYLRGFAIYLLLSLVGTGFLYFLKADIARDAFPDRVDRTRFFSSVEAAGNGLTVLLQIFVTGRVMSRFGALPALLILPLVIALAFGVFGTWHVLPVLVGVDLLRRAATYAFSKPAREVLYTVVGERERFRAKPFLDTVVYRGGDVGVAWLFELLASFGWSAGALAWFVVPCALAWAAAAVPLGRSHRTRETALDETTDSP